MSNSPIDLTYTEVREHIIFSKLRLGTKIFITFWAMSLTPQEKLKALTNPTENILHKISPLFIKGSPYYYTIKVLTIT